MSKLFDYENPVWNFVGKLVDLLILTGLWFVCSIPVITFGASTKALYTVALRLTKDEESYTISSFFREFKKDFANSTVCGLAALALGVFLAADLYVYWNMSSKLGAFLFAFFFVMALLYLMTFVYLFPMMAVTEYKGVRLVMVSFVTSLKNPGWSVLMILVMVVMVVFGLFVAAPFLVIGIGLAAYIQCKITVLVTKHYHIKTQQEEN
ncbi:MAG: YesL family protein [Lachnospiraceae bacterium]|nr:YesL family protein [Lachnospiraceae bacterium]